MNTQGSNFSQEPAGQDPSVTSRVSIASFEAEADIVRELNFLQSVCWSMIGVPEWRWGGNAVMFGGKQFENTSESECVLSSGLIFIVK